MTQVGHTLTGVICLPEKEPARWKIAHLAGFVLLANVPDFRFRYLGHHRYFISHTVFMNLFVILHVLPVFICLKDIRDKIGGWSVVVGGVLAWLSHLLLDTFYNHGKGVKMFWPFSEVRLALPIPWFSVVKNPPPPLTSETVQILLIELAFYGTLLLLVVGAKKSRFFQRIRAFEV